MEGAAWEMHLANVVHTVGWGMKINDTMDFIAPHKCIIMTKIISHDNQYNFSKEIF